MDKISYALEKQKKESSITTEGLFTDSPEQISLEDKEAGLTEKLHPGYKFNDKLVVLSAPYSVDAENFKVLRGRILFSRDHKRPRTIMVTSAYPGEGKTFVAANLAVSIALGIDEYVLAVDCDLRRPRLHEMLGDINREGLHEHLTGEKALKDLIVKTEVDKLSLLPAGKQPQNPIELLSSSLMVDFLEEIKSRYNDRFIVIDSTPSLITAEVNILANHVDGVILVVMAQKSPRAAIQKTVQNLGKEKILGIVFNGYEQAHRGYNKYYKQYYKK